MKRAGRRQKRGRVESREMSETRGRGKKKTRTTPRSDTWGREAQSERAAGERGGANGQGKNNNDR